MYKMNSYNSCINVYYYLYNNIVLNSFLIGYVFFPNIFKDRIINIKKTIDDCHNRIVMVSFRNEILDKYNIDVFDMYKQFQSILNTDIMLHPIKKKRNINYITLLTENDNISVMSSLSSSFDDEDRDENFDDENDSRSVISLSCDDDI